MNEGKSNGAEPAGPVNPLGDAITEHAKALVKAATQLTGQMTINPVQMYCDLEFALVRIDVMFEALVELGVLDPARLSIKLRDKLKAETEFLKTPQLAIVPAGSVLRGR